MFSIIKSPYASLRLPYNLIRLFQDLYLFLIAISLPFCFSGVDPFWIQLEMLDPSGICIDISDVSVFDLAFIDLVFGCLLIPILTCFLVSSC